MEFFRAVIIGSLLGFGLIYSCGLEPSEKVVEKRTVVPPPPIPTPTPGPALPPDWREIKGIVQESCAINGCHANSGFLETEAGFRNSNAKARILNGSMPPRYADNYELWQDGTRKQRVMEFLRN